MNEKKEEMKAEETEVNEINNEMNDDEISEVAGGCPIFNRAKNLRAGLAGPDVKINKKR